MNIIDKIVVKYLLTSDKVFYASLLTLINKEENKQVPTMGVTIKDGLIYLYYNNDFMNSIIEKHGAEKIKGIIEHELLHLVFDHLSRAKKYNRHQMIYNIATDIAINTLIKSEYLPPRKGEHSLLLPEDFDLPDGKNAEWYYGELVKNSKKLDLSLSGDGEGNPKTLDDHSVWNKMSGSEQINKELIKKLVNEAKNVTNKMKGTIPQGLEEAIQELLDPPKVNWRHLLRQYIGVSIKTGWKSSWKRPNRRFMGEEAFKGKVAKRDIRILVAIDTSGSISSKDLEDFIIEMKGIMNVYKSRIDIVQCDAKIQKKEQLNSYSKIKINFKGRGGTSFKPVFDYYNKKIQYDLLVYFTDLYGDEKECFSYRPVVWVTTSEYNKESKPKVGRIVNITK